MNKDEIDPKLRHGPEARPTTVGELRAFLEPFDDDTPLVPMCYGPSGMPSMMIATDKFKWPNAN
jgi:hypothetical protein